jgi:hypothetical protein
MIETFPFAGVMDLDTRAITYPRGKHISARNGIFRGEPGNMRWETVVGTNLVPNSFLPTSGTNITIGTKYDAVNQRLFFFNFNSAGTHGIYIYYTTGFYFQTLIQNGATTNGDVLGFTASGRITSADILYGDGASGDLLFYVDTLGRCTKMNIKRMLSGSYNLNAGLIKRTYLDVIKAPPIPPPYAVYENDATVTNNNVVNALFNFSCTHIYDDFEQSVLGSGSKQPLPSDPFDPQNNTPPDRNARIALYLATGDQNVTKIRIYGKQTSNGTTTDWFIIDTLDKSQLGIPNNTVYRYLFYNNGNYVASDPLFTVLDFDYVPQQANAQALLDGTVISYGGITEGYNFINPNYFISNPNVTVPQYSVNGSLFFAATNGLFTSGFPQITVYLTGVGVNDGNGNPTTLEKAPTEIIVNVQSGSFAYFNIGASNSIPFLLSSLLSNAVVDGWVTVSTSTNSFTVYNPNGPIVLTSSYLNGVASNTSPYPSPVCCFYPQSAYSFGVVYRDGGGRTNGVISNVTGNAITQAINTTGQIPEFTINLSATIPPAWAVYYDLVRTDTLTYNKYFQWVSTSAYQGTGQGVSTQYAYFGINNIQTYNTSIGASQPVASYAFSQGDRVKILGRYDSNGNFTQLNLDYAVLGVATNPVVNGMISTGSFIQIYYPTSDINSNFMFPEVSNDTNFQNYEILLYSYKAYSATNENVYFQIGQQYGIGNPGTNAAYHMGNGGVSVITLTDGDVFNRIRNVPIQSSYFINTGSFAQTSPYGTDWINPGGGAIPIVDNGLWRIVGGAQMVAGLLPTQYPTYANNDYTILNESTTQPLTIRLRGSQTIVDTTDPNGQFSKYVKIVQPGNVVTTTQIVPLQTGLQPNVPVTVVFDTTVQLPPQGKLWLINYCVNEMDIGGYLLELDVIRTRSINVFDASFSDIFALRTNADNKPNVINVEASQTYYSTLFRYSQPDVLGTDINNSNRFYPNNYDEFVKSHGDIIRLIVRQREMRVFQKRRCGRVGVYQKFVTNESANTSLIVSDTIITPNNIQYFEGEWGIGNQAAGLSSSGYADYFPDPVKGTFCRLSEDGIIPISELYRVQGYAGSSLPYYLFPFVTPFGANSVILSTYNVTKDRDTEAIFVMQPGTWAAAGETIPGQSLSFNEKMNAFQSFYDFAPDAIECCENTLYSFYNGKMYTHTNQTNWANFYGVQYQCNITMIYREPSSLQKKNFLALRELCNQPWVCPSIATDTYSYGITGQLSNLVAEDFVLLGTDWEAPLWFDQNSIGGLINGDVMAGSYAQIEFQSATAGAFSFLGAVSVRYTDSPLNVKQ